MKLALQQSQILMLSGGFSSGDEPDGSGKFIANELQNEILHAEIQALLDRDGLILGICNGFQALVKSGLLPNGEIGSLQADDPTLTHNEINRHISRMVSTRVASTLSPWTSLMKPGDIHKIAISHGEGRFYANQQWVQKLKENGQICFQYADEQGRAPLASP